MPGCLSQCSELSFLHLEHNELSNLPDSLAALEQLEELDLSHNHIKKLPDSFGQMKKLRVLNVSNNQLSTIPSSIQFMKGKIKTVTRYSVTCRFLSWLIRVLPSYICNKVVTE